MHVASCGNEVSIVLNGRTTAFIVFIVLSVAQCVFDAVYSVATAQIKAIWLYDCGFRN